MSSRAVIRHGLKSLKSTLKKMRGVKFSHRGLSACYLIDIFIPLLFSPLIDTYPFSWKWVFFFLASLQSLNIILLLSLHVKSFAQSIDSLPPLSSFFHQINPYRSLEKLLGPSCVKDLISAFPNCFYAWGRWSHVYAACSPYF